MAGEGGKRGEGEEEGRGDRPEKREGPEGPEPSCRNLYIDRYIEYPYRHAKRDRRLLGLGGFGGLGRNVYVGEHRRA